MNRASGDDMRMTIDLMTKFWCKEAHGIVYTVEIESLCAHGIREKIATEIKIEKKIRLIWHLLSVFRQRHTDRTEQNICWKNFKNFISTMRNIFFRIVGMVVTNVTIQIEIDICMLSCTCPLLININLFMYSQFRNIKKHNFWWRKFEENINLFVVYQLCSFFIFRFVSLHFFCHMGLFFPFDLLNDLIYWSKKLRCGKRWHNGETILPRKKKKLKIGFLMSFQFNSIFALNTWCEMMRGCAGHFVLCTTHLMWLVTYAIGRLVCYSEPLKIHDVRW